MEKIFIKYITKSSELTYHIQRNDMWKGYFIIVGKKTMDITVSCLLEGENAHASINILSILSGNASIHLKTLQHHVSGNAESTLLAKTVVSDKASFTFDGKIIVANNADKTDAYQRNENCILSENASAVSRPTLEILADDVHCTHGATTGEIPFDQLWYLKTRGLSQNQARTVYIQGFLNAALTGLKSDMSEKIMHRIMDI
jgi:Fe-S cluster assembly protein SufD